MSDPDPSDSSERPGQPGTTRTWWHPLLARLLDHVLAKAYRVLEEVLVGKLPLAGACSQAVCQFGRHAFHRYGHLSPSPLGRCHHCNCRAEQY